VRKFLYDFHLPFDAGIKRLGFYRSIAENEPLSLSYREIILTARIMEEIFAQVKNQEVPI